MSSADQTLDSGNQTCSLHPFETADRLCHSCGRYHCDACLVAPRGPRKPMLCVACAINRSGVRRTAGAAPLRSPKEIKRIENEVRRQEREEGRRPVVVTSAGLSRQPVPEEPDTRRSRLPWRRSSTDAAT